MFIDEHAHAVREYHVVFGSDMPFERLGEQIEETDKLSLSDNSQ